MTPEQFTYWLQGFLEVTNAKSVTEEQLQVIKDHLVTVFKKVTPDYQIDLAKKLSEPPTYVTIC